MASDVAAWLTYNQDIDHPATSSMSMSMPMKRATPTAYTTPSASASASVRMEKAPNAERLIIPYAMSPWLKEAPANDSSLGSKKDGLQKSVRTFAV